MPLDGARSVKSLDVGKAPLVQQLFVEPITLPKVEVLVATFEVDRAGVLDLLPRAVHPTIPPTATFLFWHVASGPLGPFTLAQVRMSCRAGFRSRGYLLGSFCDSERAADVLRAHWGFDCRTGFPRLEPYHDTVTATVVAEGREILRLALVDPTILSSAALELSSNFNLARVQTNGHGSAELRLLQVEPEYTVEQPDRGRARLETFVPEAWGAKGLSPQFPVSAVHFTGEVRLSRVRYLVDPDLAIDLGTTKVEEPVTN